MGKDMFSAIRVTREISRETKKKKNMQHPNYDLFAPFRSRL